MEDWEYGTEAQIEEEEQVLRVPRYGQLSQPYTPSYAPAAPQGPTSSFQPPVTPAPAASPFPNPFDALGQGLNQAWETGSAALGAVPGLAGAGQAIGGGFSGLGSAVQATFDYAGRPAGAVRSAIGEMVTPQYGGDVGRAALAGLQGQSLHSPNYAGILEAGGVGTAGLGPLDTRGVLGFGLDLALDPVNLIPGIGMGRAGLAAAEVGQAAAGAGRALPHGVRVLDDLATGFQPGGVMQRLAEHTGGAVQSVIKRATDLATPRTFADPEVGRPLIAFRHALDDIDNQVRVITAELETLGSAFTIGPDARVELPNGARLAWGDLFSAAKRPLPMLSPEQNQAIQSFKDYVRLLGNEYTQNLNDLRSIAPETATAFELPQARLPKGWDYVPRIAIREGTGDIVPVYERRAGVGGKSGFQKDRKWLTQEEAIDEGLQYVTDPTLTLGLYARFVLQEVAEMQFARALTPIAKQADFLAEQGAKAAYQASREESRGFEALSRDLNRVLRGENIPPQTIAKYAEQFPQHTEALQLALNLKDPKELAGIVRIIDEDTRRAKEISRNYANDLTAVRAQNRSETTGAGLKGVGAGYLKGLWFQPDEAQHLAESLAAKAPPGLEYLKNITDVSRAMATGLDFSGGMIQGLPLLARLPDRWLKAQGEALKATFDPANLSRYLAREENQYVLRNVPGLQVSGEEYFSATQRGGALERAGVPGKVVSTALRPAERAFTTFGTVARVELAKALYPTFARENRLADLADFVNHATGAISMKGMGIGPGQQAVEATFLAFAPRYTRASLALVGDIMSGGAKGQEALNSLASMAVVGNAMYQHIAHSLGQEPFLNPKDGWFMTVEIGGQRIGVGTIWTSLTRMLGKLATDPERGLALETTNPIAQFLRGRLPLIPGALLDSVMNETVIGTPLQTLPDYARYGVSKVIPFWADALITDLGDGKGLSAIHGTAAEMVGARVFPQTLDDVRNQVAVREFGKKWDDLDPVERAKVSVSEEVKKVPMPRGQRFESHRQASSAHEKYGQELEALAGSVGAGTVNKAQFRERIKDVAAARNTRLADIEKSTPRTPSADPNESAYQTYLSYYRARNELGQPDHEGAEAYYAALPEDQQRFIDKKQAASLEYLGPQAKPLLTELRAAQRALEPYWDVENEVFARLGIYREYQAASPAEKARLKKTDPRFKAADKIIDQRREALRRSNPTIDRYLVEWHNLTPIMQQGLAQGGGSSGFGGFSGFRGFS